jgi:hypothetical protein
VTAGPAESSVSPIAPATGVQAIQNSAPVTAQQVHGLDPRSWASRTGRHDRPVATSTAIAIPAPNQVRNEGSHRFSGAPTRSSASDQPSHTSPSTISTPSPASTRPGRHLSPDSRANPATSSGRTA